ncbi:MAG: hypothetical protein AB7F74_27115 [Parvibaculaceae bacterium]
MRVSEYLIDNFGRERPIGKVNAAALGLPERHDAMVDIAIGERGWAAVRQTTTRLHIRCAPGRISDLCHFRLSALIRKSKHRVRTLDIPAEGGCASYQKSFTSRKSAEYVLSAMVAGRRDRSGASFEAIKRPFRPIDLETIARSYVAGFQTGTLNELSVALDGILREPWLLWRQEAGQPESICAAISGLYTPFNSDWYATAVGRRASEFADVHYGIMMSRGHSRVLESGTALRERVEARVDLPDAGPTVLSFARLLIPILRPDGERLVLSTPRLEAIAPSLRKDTSR